MTNATKDRRRGRERAHAVEVYIRPAKRKVLSDTGESIGDDQHRPEASTERRTIDTKIR